MCARVSVCGHVHMRAGQRNLEPRLRMAVRHTVPGLGTKLGPSGRAASASNWRALSPALYICILYTQGHENISRAHRSREWRKRKKMGRGRCREDLPQMTVCPCWCVVRHFCGVGFLGFLLLFCLFMFFLPLKQSYPSQWALFCSVVCVLVSKNLSCWQRETFLFLPPLHPPEFQTLLSASGAQLIHAVTTRIALTCHGFLMAWATSVPEAWGEGREIEVLQEKHLAPSSPPVVSLQEERAVRDRNLLQVQDREQPIPWKVQFNLGNSSRPSNQCRNSVQGKHLITDELGTPASLPSSLPPLKVQG